MQKSSRPVIIAIALCITQAKLSERMCAVCAYAHARYV